MCGYVIMSYSAVIKYHYNTCMSSIVHGSISGIIISVCEGLFEIFQYARTLALLFVISCQSDKYRLRIAGYDANQSTMRDLLTMSNQRNEPHFLNINNMRFTTYDNDNDMFYLGNCTMPSYGNKAEKYVGWWYYICAYRYSSSFLPRDMYCPSGGRSGHYRCQSWPTDAMYGLLTLRLTLIPN